MSRKKTERLLNLTWTLMATQQFLTRGQIRSAVDGYGEGSPDAFERMFERDKEELRELGVPIQTGTHSALGDEIGYRIPQDSAMLPDLQFTAEEAAVIGLASHVWEHAGLATDSGHAVVKLKAIGIDVDTDAVRVAEPRLSAGEAAFDAVWDAVHARQRVQFTYQRPGGEPARREVEPWGIVNWHGRWYMGGWDLDRRSTRLFRLGRIVSDVLTLGAPGAYEVPAGTDWREVARGLFGAPPTSAAEVRVRKGRAHWLRRAADSVEELDGDFDLARVPYASTETLAAEIASYGPDAVAVAPADLRAATMRVLAAAAGGAQ